MESIQKNNKYCMEQTATKKCPIYAQFTNKPKICQDFVAFVYIKLFVSIILQFQKVVIFARIKAEISGERRKILFLTPVESRCESKCYKFTRIRDSTPTAPVTKK